MYSSHFPSLKHSGYRITSPQTVNYNCIAWAADDDSSWWWPDRMNNYYWPPGIPREETLNAFIQAYGLLGYSVCDNQHLEFGFQKVAIYVLDGKPTHAARQLPNGCWTSKLGKEHDIEHNFIEGLFGPTYGQLGVIMKRQVMLIV